MAEIAWEKPKNDVQLKVKSGSARFKFLIGGVLILGAIAYLIISGTASGARYFITVDEIVKSSEYLGQTVRISGVVDGETIQYDSENLIIEFTIANIPEQTDNLAKTLHESINNPLMKRINVRVEGQVKPDLLQHEAQAILTGELDENGVFHASELLLKCPSRFEEDAPNHPAVAGEV